MRQTWYCATCGYEVDSGGRCHNCGNFLISSSLEELREEDSVDEVGYRLTGWRDNDRGRLIEALIACRVRHRFEGDELVVGAENEDVVDSLVAELDESPEEAASAPAPRSASSHQRGTPNVRTGTAAGLAVAGWRLIVVLLVAIGIVGFLWGGSNSAHERCIDHRLGDRSFMGAVACAVEH
jgi:hypothetical protein